MENFVNKAQDENSFVGNMPLHAINQALRFFVKILSLLRLAARRWLLLLKYQDK